MVHRPIGAPPPPNHAEPYKGTIRRRWKPKSEKNTHWLNASYYSDVAANTNGIKLVAIAKKQKAKPQRTLTEMACGGTEAGSCCPVSQAMSKGGNGGSGWACHSLRASPI